MLHVYPFSPSNPLLLYPMVVGVLKAVLYFIAFSGVSSTPRHHHSSNPQNQPARDNRYRYHWPKLHRDGDLTFLPVGHLNLCCVFFSWSNFDCYSRYLSWSVVKITLKSSGGKKKLTIDEWFIIIQIFYDKWYMCSSLPKFL